MKYLVDDILVNENDSQIEIRKKVANHLGANYRTLRIEIVRRRWVRTETGGAIRLCVLAESSEFLRSTTAFSYNPEEESSCTSLKWKERPVVVGFGVPGIVAAYYLAKRGLRPIVLERGNSISIQGTSPKDRETLNPDGEGGLFSYTGMMLCLDNLDPELNRMFESDDITFGGPDAYRFVSPLELRTILAKLHSAIIDAGGEVIFNATYLGIKKWFKRMKGVLYNHEGRTKLIKTTKLLLTYGASDDTFFIGTSIPCLEQPYNECVYGRKIVDSKAAPFYVEQEIKVGRASKVLFLTGLKGARVMDIGTRSELCMQSYNFDGKGRHVHSLIGVEATKEEVERICKNAYDASKPKRIPCSAVNDYVAKRNPLRLGSIKPEKVGDIRLDSFSKLLGPTVSKRFSSALNHLAKTYPYLLSKDTILEGLFAMPGCNDDKPIKVDGAFVSRIPASRAFDFASKATGGYRAAKLLCDSSSR